MSDVLLVVEIAHTSLRYDRDVKAALYARHHIIEYWLADLATSTVTCYTSPQDGTYREAAIRARGDHLAPRRLPDCVIAVDDLL